MEHEAFVPFPAETVRQALTDPARVSRCVPGFQRDADDSAPPLTGRLRLRIGGSTITYRGALRITALDSGDLAVEAEGAEARGSGSVKLTLTIRPVDADGGTTLVCTGTVSGDGRITDVEEATAVAAGHRLLDRCAAELAADLETTPIGPTGVAAQPGAEADSGPRTGAADAGPRTDEGEPGEGGRAPRRGRLDADDDNQPVIPGIPAPDSHDRPHAQPHAQSPAGADEAEGGPAATGGASAKGGSAAKGTEPGESAAAAERPEAGGPTEPGEPTGPGGPTRPARPAEPTKPTGHTGRTKPTGPTGPTESTGPGGATRSGEPSPPPAPDDATAFGAGHAEFAGATGHDETDTPAEPPAEAAHARRTMIGRSAEEVDHAPPRGRYAPVPAPQPGGAGATLRWAAPAAAVLLASAVVVGRILRRRHH
ncbi:SRPBCC family protein [Streptomyces sp. URMC 123]|uniref:SRPBCC family protein n=1 Tax=Streptomyces sp. URMC 123 TaxID=3423403 RepID=UPI003F1E2EC8